MPTPAKFAVAVMVLRQDDNGSWQVVLVARKDDHSRWSLPGGKVDRGEDSLMAAVRELREETGIHLRWNNTPGPGASLCLTTRSLIPQETMLDSGGYLTTFYLLDTTRLDLPDEFEPREGEAPVRWGKIEELFDGPFGDENRERFRKMRIVR